MCGYYSCYSCCGCYRVIGVAIKIISGTAIRTTCSIAVKIANRIGEGSYGRYCGHCYRNSYRDFYKDFCKDFYKDFCRDSCKDSCGA